MDDNNNKNPIPLLSVESFHKWKFKRHNLPQVKELFCLPLLSSIHVAVLITGQIKTASISEFVFNRIDSEMKVRRKLNGHHGFIPHHWRCLPPAGPVPLSGFATLAGMVYLDSFLELIPSLVSSIGSGLASTWIRFPSLTNAGDAVLASRFRIKSTSRATCVNARCIFLLD